MGWGRKVEVARQRLARSQECSLKEHIYPKMADNKENNDLFFSKLAHFVE